MAAASQCNRRWFVVIYGDDAVVDAGPIGVTKSYLRDDVDEHLNSEWEII